MNFRPLGDRIVILPDAAETESAGGLIIPDSALKAPQRGTVVAVGPGKPDIGPPAVSPADVVLYSKFAGTEITLDGVDHLIMAESDILGIVGESNA